MNIWFHFITHEFNNSTKWANAMIAKLKFVKHNKVQDLVEFPKRCKCIECKWVFKTKCDSLANIEQYEARLIAKGFIKKAGLDDKETFSPISKKDFLKFIMALVSML